MGPRAPRRAPSCGRGRHQAPGPPGCRTGDTPLPPTPPSHVSPRHQLFNIYPRLGALLRLHRPVLRKIEEVRAILTTLLEARRPPAPGGGPVHSYVDALIRQGQVWPGPPPPRPLEAWGSPRGPTPGGVRAGPAPGSCASWLGASLSPGLTCEVGVHSACRWSGRGIVSPEPAGAGAPLSFLPSLSSTPFEPRAGGWWGPASR